MIGILPVSRFSESGEPGNTISFDYMAETGIETTMCRKTVVFGSEARLGGREVAESLTLELSKLWKL